MAAQLHLHILEGELGICRLDAVSPIPGWAAESPFYSVTRTPDELSIVTGARAIPAGMQVDEGWRAIQMVGPFDFSLIGIMLSVLTPLANAGISVLAVSTFDTDYVLVKEARLDEAIAALTQAGHTISG